MYTVMVTGGIGSGKSTLCELLCEHGAVSIDLDSIARTVLVNDSGAIAELVDEFGLDILDEDGAVVARQLAQAAFADAESVRAMNAIMFPRIIDQATEYVLDVHCCPRSDSTVLVVEVPLLTEVPKFAELADEVISVTSPVDIRVTRAIARGMDARDVLKRMALQPSDDERAAMADTVCDNTGSIEDLRMWVNAWWNGRFDTLFG